MCKYKMNVKQVVEIILISIICCSLNFTSFADSNSDIAYKADTWYKLNDRPSGNEGILSLFPNENNDQKSIGLRSNDVNKIVTINNCIYMNNNDGTVLEYNTEKDTWTSIDKINGLSESNGFFKLITLNNKIYIVGAKLSDILEYDISKKKSILITKLPTQTRVDAAIGIENKIYILSCDDMGNIKKKITLYIYDLTRNEWTKKQSMFEGSIDLKATYLKGNIYIYSGFNFQVYDIKNDRWANLTPFNMRGSGMEVFNGKIYVLPYKVNDAVKEYNPISNTWISKAVLPFEISTSATTLCNGEIYVIDNKNVAKYTIVDRKINNEDINKANEIEKNIDTNSENSGVEANKENVAEKDDNVISNAENNDSVESKTGSQIDSDTGKSTESEEDDNHKSYIDMNEIKIKVNDKLFDFPDAKPFIDNNYRTQVPIKFIVEALGATVSWNGKTRQAIITKGEDTLIFTIGKKEYTFNNQTLIMDTAAMIKQNRTFVPIRYIGEAFGFDILVDMGTNTITLYMPDIAGYTEDGLEIYKIDGKEFVALIDIQRIYDCIGFSDFNNTMIIYGKKTPAEWAMENIKPLMATKMFITKDDLDYFQLDYYENNIKPMLSKSIEVEPPTYTKNGYDIYLFNNKEYVLPNDIIMPLDKYLFMQVSDEEFYVIKINEEFSVDYDVIMSDIPATVINGRLMIEYAYYTNNILPKIDKLDKE